MIKEKLFEELEEVQTRYESTYQKLKERCVYGHGEFKESVKYLSSGNILLKLEKKLNKRSMLIKKKLGILASDPCPIIKQQSITGYVKNFDCRYCENLSCVYNLVKVTRLGNVI